MEHTLAIDLVESGYAEGTLPRTRCHLSMLLVDAALFNLEADLTHYSTTPLLCKNISLDEPCLIL